MSSRRVRRRSVSDDRAARRFGALRQSINGSRRCSAITAPSTRSGCSRALAESNLTKPARVPPAPASDRDLPDDLIDQMAHAGNDRGPADRRASWRQVLDLANGRLRAVFDLLATLDVDAMALHDQLPVSVMPTAMAALRDVLLGTIDDVTAWIDLHSLDPALRARTAELRAATDATSRRRLVSLAAARLSIAAITVGSSGLVFGREPRDLGAVGGDDELLEVPPDVAVVAARVRDRRQRLVDRRGGRRR